MVEGTRGERRGDEGGQDPVGGGGQPVPQGQVLAVVHVERGGQDDVGAGHGEDVGGVAGPAAPQAGVGPPPVVAAGGGQCESERAEQEQVVVAGRPQRGHRGRGGEHDGDRPVVHGSGAGVPAAALGRGGGQRAGDHGGEPGHHVHGEDRQEQRPGPGHGGGSPRIGRA